MNKEFIPYEQALELKKLGFDEECLLFYNYKQQLNRYINPDRDWNDLKFQTLRNSKITVLNTYTAPTFSQTFRWFRETYELSSWVYNSHMDKYFYTILQDGRIVKATVSETTYEEAELACLKKLIEIVKSNTDKK